MACLVSLTIVRRKIEMNPFLCIVTIFKREIKSTSYAIGFVFPIVLLLQLHVDLVGMRFGGYLSRNKKAEIRLEVISAD